MMYLDSVDAPGDDVGAENICLATDAEDISYQEYLYRGEWFDALEVYWKDTMKFGPFCNRSYKAKECRTQDNALISARIRLEAGETKTLRFVISWNHPLNRNTWKGEDSKRSDIDNQWLAKSWKNYYALLWENSAKSASYALENWQRLYRATADFRDALFSSSLPQEVLDAVSANISVLKSPTVWRLEDGTLYGWEGVGEREGSCEGSCTHVWGYAQALPFLFPALSRSMRRAEYDYNWADDGSMSFRLMLPLGAPRWNFRPAADGQFATIMKTYREWRISGDTDWLKAIWPRVKKSLEFAWSSENCDLWDPGKTGTLSGRQHHTLDMELFGPNSWLSGMYLGALKAGMEMAAAMSESDAEQEYRSIFEKGCAVLNDQLYNGEYFIQDINLEDPDILSPYKEKYPTYVLGSGTVSDVYWSDELKEIKYQIGEGVSIDQMLGQWHADLYGLGQIFDPEKVQKALGSLFKYNFKETMRKYYNPCRIYCLNDESGLTICSWPEDKQKPAIPAPYSQETMHGFEYAAADLMIRRGMKEKGLKVVKAIRDRYDGRRRNPWNEIECGSNYARSMASYALLLSFSGFSFDARKDHLSFNPPQWMNSRYFWSFRSAWGVIEFQGIKAMLFLRGGCLPLRSLGLPESFKPIGLSLNGDNKTFTMSGDFVVLEDRLLLTSGDCLTLSR